MAQPLGSVSAGPGGWTHAQPAEAGFAPDLEARLDKAVADKRVWNLHGLVVARHGRLVLERYWEGQDFAWGRDVGRVAFKADTIHDLRSVTKSIVGLLYGIALAEGKVPPPEAPLFQSFPDYADLGADPARARLTLHHVLSMSMGTDWDETTVPYTNPANSEIAMEFSPDLYRYILERKVVMEPGKHWTYSGGATALLGRIIAAGTGTPLHAYARRVLFDPLGLGPTEWTVGRDSVPSAASGLRMAPRDLARIGHMLASGGAFEGARVVPATWLERCFTPVVSCDERRRFGYQWYLGDFVFGQPPRARLERWWGAFGNGGQRLFVLPTFELVVAITAGNYDTPDQWVPPIRVMREVVLASLQ
jgi:CubicO group peptidase (beta-lactamase class C family)